MPPPSDPACTQTAAGDALARCGLRCTRQRQAVYSALCEADSHPTADELFKAVRRELPGVSLATVYNTLETLVEHQLVRKLPVAEGGASARYDADLDPHYHARCARTGRVFDLSESISRRLREAMPAELIREMEAELGARVADIRIEVVAEPVESQS